MAVKRPEKGKPKKSKKAAVPTQKAVQKQKQVEALPVNSALQASITPLGIDFANGSMTLGENYCRVYGAVRFPSEVNYGWLARLTNIPGTIVSIGYVPVDNGDFVEILNSKVALEERENRETNNALDRLKTNKAAHDAKRVMEHIELNGERIGNYTLTLMVLSRDLKDFYDNCSRAENIAATLGCKIRPLANLQKEGYKQIAPFYPLGNAVGGIINRPFLVSTFVGGFPFAASGFADEAGYYLGKNSDGGAILYDLWKRSMSRTNSNITIFGASGMGKSTIVKHILTSEYARGTKVIIIDPEGEYREICRSKNVSGSWIDVAGSRGGIINPLHVRPVPRDDDEDEDKFWSGRNTPSEHSEIGDVELHIKFLETFFKLYRPSFTDRHIAIISKILIELYGNFRITSSTDVTKLRPEQFPTMSDLYGLIKKKTASATTHKELFDDIELLVEGAANGADRGLWNGHTTIKGDNDFIVLDTKSILQMSGGVLEARYFNILSWCWEQISADNNQRIILVADEAWMMIDEKCPQSLAFLRNAEKRARKYEGAIIVSTQNIVDFLDPSIKKYGQEVLDSPSVKIIFGADGKTLQEVQSVFELNEAQKRLVENKQRGVALMKIGAQSVKIKFELSEKRLAMFGSGGGR
jgi:hypothetical protein